MPTDLDTLLPHAGRDPHSPLDADALWTRGRRRRTIRHAAATGGSLTAIAALALVTSSLVGGVGTAVPEIAPMAPPAGTGQEDTDTDAGEADGSDREADETDAVDDAYASALRRDELAAAEHQRPTGPGEPDESDGSVQTDDEGVSNDASPDGSPTTSTGPDRPSSPTPDWTRAADPCAVHDPDDVRAFIDVVSPVDGQQIETGAVALVGCASVYEGTVRYRISRGGTVVEDGFVTASAGGPELGEFRKGIALGTTGTHILEVFWDSPADGEGERDLQTFTFEVR
jgi:hypothetical protein